MLPVEVHDPAIRVIIPSGEDRLYDVAERALADQMYVIHNGSTVLVCSIIPAGWKKLAVKDKTLRKSPQKDHSSAIGGVLGDVPALPVLQAPLKMGA